MNTGNWIAQLNEITDLFLTEFGSLSPEQLNFKPNNKKWSIAQNIDHLIKINNSYFPVITAVRNNSLKLPFTSKIEFIVNSFGKMILKAVQPERKRRMKTFSVWEPAQSNFSSDIIEKFKISQDELKTLIEGSDELIKNGAVIYSPANKKIVYKLETAYDIIILHERRHFEQAVEIKKLLS